MAHNLEEARELIIPPFGNDTWLRNNPWDTEAEAAEYMSRFSEAQRLRVLKCIATANDKRGRTDYETHVRTGIHKNDVASRRKELQERGWVRDLEDVRRPTANSTGVAWALTTGGRLLWDHDIEPYL